MKNPSILTLNTFHDLFQTADGHDQASHRGCGCVGACAHVQTGQQPGQQPEGAVKSGSANFSSDGTEIQEDFSLQDNNFRWQQPGGKGSPLTLTYSYTNLFDGGIKGGITNAEMKSAVQEAFKLWSKYAPISFVEIQDKGTKSRTNPDGADIRIGHQDLGGRGGTLGRANLRYDGELATIVVFDNKDLWETDRIGSTQDFLAVAVHEIGHALGLRHTESQSSVMRPFVTDSYSGLGSGFIFNDDINGIRALFGSGSGSVKPLSGGGSGGSPTPTPPAKPQRIVGTNSRNVFTGDNNVQVFVSLGGNDVIRAGGGNDRLYGGSGSDQLLGQLGNDLLVGVASRQSKPGSNERDTLIGGQGADVFFLGDTRNVYYNDGFSNTLGRNDYAIIEDFSQSSGDKIQLRGKASDYSLGAAPSGTASGKAIFLNTPGQDELIGIVKGNNGLSLQSSAFRFV